MNWFRTANQNVYQVRILDMLLNNRPVLDPIGEIGMNAEGFDVNIQSEVQQALQNAIAYVSSKNGALDARQQEIANQIQSALTGSSPQVDNSIEPSLF